MSIGLCIGLIGATIHVLPADAVTLRWVHTVEGTPWEEDLVVEGGALRLREARIKRSGAGMDPPPDAVWTGGWWRYIPNIAPLTEIVLANSEFADGYTVCWGQGVCLPLDRFISKGSQAKIVVTPCPSVRDRR